MGQPNTQMGPRPAPASRQSQPRGANLSPANSSTNTKGGGENPLGPLSGLVSSSYQDLIGTGYGFDTSGVEQGVRDAFGVERATRSADMRERLGGLGYRFSTPLMREERLLDQELGLQQSGYLGNLRAGLFDSAANRRAGATQGALNLPNMIAGSFNQGAQATMDPYTRALQYAAGFAPVGSSSNSKSAEANVGW